MKLGNSTMTFARPQRNLSAKKVRWSCNHMSAVLFVKRVWKHILLTAKGQGPPPQPPTSGPGELDSTPAAVLQHARWISVFVWIQTLCLLQDGTPNVASGHLIRITTTATCSTTCPWGRGRRPGLTASTRAVTSSASLIPLNRPSYKVVPSSPQFSFVLLMIQFLIFKHCSSFCEQQLGCFASCLCSYYKNIWLTIIRTTLKWAEPGSLCKTHAEVRFMLFNTRGRQRLSS